LDDVVELYRSRAAEAEAFAARAIWDDLKEGFLRIADQYRRLAEAAEARKKPPSR
jgi:hypothetical protein